MIGSHEKFGRWQSDYFSIPLEWNSGNVWTLTLDKKLLPKRSEFKFILKCDNRVIKWEERSNRAFDINIIQYALRTSKNIKSKGYTLIDQRTTKLEYDYNKESVILTHKWDL